MELNTYLKTIESAANLARKLKVAEAMISQWKLGIRSIPPVRCIQIETATSGAVTRKELRPDDWAAIWPEFINK